MKNENKMESMTMEEVKKALDEAVEKYNSSDSTSEKVELEVESKNLVAKYNELSLLAAYAEFVKAENPVVAIAQAYNYDTIGVKFSVVTDVIDGKTVTVKVASTEPSKKTHDLFNFLTWAEKHNKKFAAAADYKGKVATARDNINKCFKKQVESADGYKISKTTVKNNLQDVFDAVVFVPGESGKNSIYPTRDGVNILINIAAKLEESIENGEVKFELNFLGKSKWGAIIFKALHLAIKGKEITYTYGDPEKKPAKPAADK